MADKLHPSRMDEASTATSPPPPADQAGGARSPPPPSAPPPRADLLPIAFADGAVTVGDGMLLLDRVSPQARVQHPAGTDMVLLSFAVSGGDAAMEDFALGALHCKRWLCCARNKLWWMTPEWGRTARELPPETQFLLAELEDGAFACILPLISQQKFRGTLRPPRRQSNAS
ncbi:galactinol-sucrose galactosyltransferase 2 [Micractinium conductrix]|uniref:Galactinol-sucrose galactosyltransferase 2 n=1 Tax=Micractinium conductrix TaxID=554055 RepID=A0A2P6VRF2_9CHLO|nr:galactinol-sucrose galactosyltransferase 2 [Micractinium conductrix]|eukprot:PSC76674.1 galactinol-sucrose galactosyltransferase 2 [Micractinium conductrix]